MFQYKKSLTLEHPYKSKFKKLGITQKILAHLCGVSFQTMFQMMNGYRPMNKSVETKLSELMNGLNGSKP